MSMLISCDNHGKFLHGYCVCNHVTAGAAVYHIERATDEELGASLCKQCFEKTEQLTVGDLKLICESCCKEQGFLTLVQ